MKLSLIAGARPNFMKIAPIVHAIQKAQEKGPDDDITAFVLFNNGHFKLLINKGNHRISALTALGYKDVSIRIETTTIPSFIYRDEVKFWPNIQCGLYSCDQALIVFDTIFNRKTDWTYGC